MATKQSQQKTKKNVKPRKPLIRLVFREVFLFGTANDLRIKVFICLWEKTLQGKDDTFLVILAKAMPYVLTLKITKKRSLSVLYSLIGRTLEKVKGRNRERVASAVQASILRVIGVPEAAKEMIAERRDILILYPEVWRNIGGFALGYH